MLQMLKLWSRIFHLWGAWFSCDASLCSCSWPETHIEHNNEVSGDSLTLGLLKAGLQVCTTSLTCAFQYLDIAD